MTERVLKSNLDSSISPNNRYGGVNRTKVAKNAPKNLKKNGTLRGKKRSKNGCLSCKKLRIKVRIKICRHSVKWIGVILTSIV